MEKEKTGIPMGKDMKGNLWRAISKALEHIFISMEIYMKDNGKKISVMDVENKFIQMGLIMKVSGSKMKNMGQVFSIRVLDS